MEWKPFMLLDHTITTEDLASQAIATSKFAGVLIGVLQKHTIKQYIRSAKTAELIAPLTEGFSDISRPVVLQIRFPKTYQGEIKHIPIW